MANTHSLNLERDSSQYAGITDASQTGLDITGDLTLEAWIKLESLPVNPTAVYFSIFTKWAGGGNISYALNYNDESGVKKIRFLNSSDGITSGILDTEYTLSIATWYHIALTYDASAGSAILYLNGSELNSGTGTLKTSLYNGTAPFQIGAENGNHFFDGLIDEARVWNDIRTAGEILANYKKQLVGTEAGLAGYWKLNNNYLDETANNNDLTASGSPVFSTDVPFLDIPGGNPMFFGGGVTVG